MTRFCPRIGGALGLLFVTGALLAAPLPVFKGWGQAGDPDGDCRFEQKNGKLTIEVPGTIHNLAADIRQFRAIQRRAARFQPTGSPPGSAHRSPIGAPRGTYLCFHEPRWRSLDVVSPASSAPAGRSKARSRGSELVHEAF